MGKPAAPQVGYEFETNYVASGIFKAAQRDSAALEALKKAVQGDAVLKLELNMSPDDRGAEWKFDGNTYHVVWRWNPKPTLATVYNIHQ